MYKPHRYLTMYIHNASRRIFVEDIETIDGVVNESSHLFILIMQ